MKESVEGIAIIGMIGRFPMAGNIDMFWQNLRDGVSSLTSISDQNLTSMGIDPTLLNAPNYIKSGYILENADLFDASFFGYSPREAELIDPQQRIFLEGAWEALEEAGYDAASYGGLIGVYAGTGLNIYLANLYSHQATGGLEAAGDMQLVIGNNKDFLTTRVSYKLNLKGPSIDIQTACSSSLVAVSMACQSLMNYQCDIALAGGVSVSAIQGVGYFYEQGSHISPDGYCRSFDARAGGTAKGNGMGIVVLKRYEEAIKDGDHIYAVIRGSAINNDGSPKAGYTAPSVEGRAEVIAMAQAMSGVNPETISYIEAHGTGKPIDDSTEIAALTRVFRAHTRKKGFCAVGSVKTNIGDLDAAAGVAGLIKAALALDHKQIPSSLHFEKPNPEIDFEESPFYVNTRLSEWKKDEWPRRAGVSSFGVGGTNAHVVLEEAAPARPSSKGRPWQIIVLSAKTESALDTASLNLTNHLKAHTDISFADVAYTLQVGRKAFDYRKIVVCQNAIEAASLLESKDAKRISTRYQEAKTRSIAFMFTGQGSQYVNMGLELYQTESVFREQFDRCCQILKPILELDLRQIIYPPEADKDKASEQLKQTMITQPALFVIEYSLAKLWMSWGIVPQAMIGHSIGEYVAATLAGVFKLEDALELVVLRARMMQKLPSGSMLAVQLPEENIKPLLDRGLSLAAINGPALCVVSGPTETIEQFEKTLAEKRVSSRRLHTSHAFHSEMMMPMIEPFSRQVMRFSSNRPNIPYISNVTGTWIKPEEATDPGYWSKHVRQCVRFADGVKELIQDPDRILLEVGPGDTLCTLAKGQIDRDRVALSSIRHPLNQDSDNAFLMTTLGKLWLAGVRIDWPGFYARERRLRVVLPTYPFQRQRYWIDKPRLSSAMLPKSLLERKSDFNDWFYVPSWKRSFLPGPSKDTKTDQMSHWLLLTSASGPGFKIAVQLKEAGDEVITVTPGTKFSRTEDENYTLNPERLDDYQRLIKDLKERDKHPQRILHMWSLAPALDRPSLSEHFKECQKQGFYSLLYLTQALDKENVTDAIRVWVVTNNTQEVTGEEPLSPDHATLHGACKVIPQEYPNLTIGNIDTVIPEPETEQEKRLVSQIIKEIQLERVLPAVAYRGDHRWVQNFERIQPLQKGFGLLKQSGVYLITGGLGSIGMVLAEYLAKSVHARLILTGRSSFPQKEKWDSWISSHDEDDTVTKKIHALKKLEEAGSEVLVLNADVSDEKQMQAVIDTAYERFGRIDGVFHGAGTTGEKWLRPIKETRHEECEGHFSPKVYGLHVLEKLFENRRPDFCFLLSSLSSVLGGLGFVAYAAANSYMDGFASWHNKKSTVPWISVNWDGWAFSPDPKASLLAITPDEGAEAFERILNIAPATQVLVSARDLQARIDHWVIPQTTEKEKEKAVPGSQLHPRPELHSSYVAPENELEEKIAQMWQEVLGIDKVGINDNFFELGGNSLMGFQLNSRIRDILGVELPTHKVFEAPTIAELVDAIAQKVIAETDSEALAGLLPEIEKLPEDEDS